MLDTFATNLIESSKEDASWTSPILMPSTVWYSGDSKQLPLINQSGVPLPSSKIDIVQLIKPPTTVNLALLQHQLKYPKSCSFMFEGYTNLKDSVLSLKNDIFVAAREGGQELALRNSTSNT